MIILTGNGRGQQFDTSKWLCQSLCWLNAKSDHWHRSIFQRNRTHEHSSTIQKSSDRRGETIIFVFGFVFGFTHEKTSFFLTNSVLCYHQIFFSFQKHFFHSISQFQEKPKLGGERFVSAVQQKIESIIEEQFLSFNQTNGEKRKNFIVSLSINYSVLLLFHGIWLRLREMSDDFDDIFLLCFNLWSDISFEIDLIFATIEVNVIEFGEIQINSHSL